jgi:alcohol dehydrogenase YqhD (iron-dependent ADH family)
MKKKIVNGKIEMFNATIRTVQDILQNSYSAMQLLILDMKDESIDTGIIHKAEKNLEEMHKAIKTLAGIDPQNIKLEDLNKSVSIIRVNDNRSK